MKRSPELKLQHKEKKQKQFHENEKTEQRETKENNKQPLGQDPRKGTLEIKISPPVPIIMHNPVPINISIPPVGNSNSLPDHIPEPVSPEKKLRQQQSQLQLAIKTVRAAVHFAGVSRQAEERRIEDSLAKRHTGVWDAIRKSDTKLVMKLIENNPKILEERGGVGENPLHLCFLLGTPLHLELAQWILTRYPNLVSNYYNGSVYYGETCLHIAIIHKNLEMVKYLVNKDRSLLTIRATGTFFQEGKPCYYGEYPLAFACCTNQQNIAKFLIHAGANLNIIDSNDNTILHLLVLHGLSDMYEFVIEQWENLYKSKIQGDKKKTLRLPARDHPLIWKRTNKDQLTPLTLAAKEGSKEMFSFLLERRKQVQWKYGPVTCLLQPLDEVDHILDHEEEEDGDHDDIPPAALQIIADNARLDLLTLPFVVELVTKKWERFAYRIFVNRFVSTGIYLLIFSLTIISGRFSFTTTSATSASELVPDFLSFLNPVFYCLRLIAEIIVVLGAIYKGRMEGREMIQGFRAYFSRKGSGFVENILSSCFCLCIVISFLFQVFDSNIAIPFRAIACITGWTYMLFFLLAFRMTGPFIVMIFKMLVGDVMRFCLIYFVFVMAFSQAFFVLFDGAGLMSFFQTLDNIFMAMFGNFSFTEYISKASSFYSTTTFLLVSYVVIVTILLLNLLVAMMGDTYNRVLEESDKQWWLERARIIFSIQSEMTLKEKALVENRYWVVVDEERYLQVQNVNPDHWTETDNGNGLLPEKKNTYLLPRSGSSFNTLFRRSQITQDQLEDALTAAAIKIQKVWRGHRVRSVFPFLSSPRSRHKRSLARSVSREPKSPILSDIESARKIEFRCNSGPLTAHGGIWSGRRDRMFLDLTVNEFG